MLKQLEETLRSVVEARASLICITGEENQATGGWLSLSCTFRTCDNILQSLRLRTTEGESKPLHAPRPLPS